MTNSNTALYIISKQKAVDEKLSTARGLITALLIDFTGSLVSCPGPSYASSLAVGYLTNHPVLPHHK